MDMYWVCPQIVSVLREHKGSDDSIMPLIFGRIYSCNGVSLSVCHMFASEVTHYLVHPFLKP